MDQELKIKKRGGVYKTCCNKSCHDIILKIKEAEAAKTSPGRIARREPKPVKLRISMFRRQDKRKERPGGLKN